MINDTINKIEEKIKSTKKIDHKKQNELLKLVSDLKKEIIKLSSVDMDNAQSIANFTKVSTHETVKENPDSELINLSINGLALSVKRFEVSHPELVSSVNAICNYLANMGI